MALLLTAENILRLKGGPGHEIIFVYRGRLLPQPAAVDATLIESDGAVVPPQE